MKKCLTIAMLVVVVAILAIVPVSAVAPLIDPLPRILIGNDSGSYKIQQAFMIDDYVDWTHGGTKNAGRKLDAMHVYLHDASGLVTGYNDDGNFPDLGNAGVAVLVGAGTPDAAFDQNISSGFGATPDEQFVRWVSLKATGVGAADVDFYAAISAGDMSSTWTLAALPVRAVAGAKSVAQFETKTPIKPPTGAISAWQVGVDPSFGFTAPDPVQTAAGVGWNISTSLPAAGTFNFATIKPSVDGSMFFIPSDGGGLEQPVFLAEMTLGNDTATGAAQACGYRLSFSNGAFTHRGTFAVPMGMDILGPIYPLKGANYVASIMWETPLSLTDMGDTGRIARFTANGPDGRDYTLQFDVIDWAGTQGYFTLNAINVRTFEAAEDLAVTMVKEWDGAVAGPSFADWMGAGGLELPPFSFGPGTFVKTDGSFTMGLGQTSPAMVFEKANGGYTQAENLPAVAGMACLKANLASTSVPNTPILRLYTTQMPESMLAWEEFWGANVFTGGVKDNGSGGVGQPVGAINPGVPTEAGSTITAYYRVPSADANEYILPQFQTYSVGMYGGSNAWPIDNGAFEFTYVGLGTIVEQ